MYLVPFPGHPGCWLYSEYNAFEADSFLVVLDGIISLFDVFMPAREDNPLRVSLVRRRESPCCFRGSHEIFLNTRIQYVSQAVYQFSHEMCHYRIPYVVPGNLRWLEESICETASHFFMLRLAHVLAAKGEYPALQRYSPRFVDYSRKVLRDCREIDTHSPRQIRRLELNEYLREENRFIASLLLPFVNTHPIFWQAVPFLGDIPPGFSLTDSFAIWQKKAPAGTWQTLEKLLMMFYHS